MVTFSGKTSLIRAEYRIMRSIHTKISCKYNSDLATGPGTCDWRRGRSVNVRHYKVKINACLYDAHICFRLTPRLLVSSMARTRSYRYEWHLFVFIVWKHSNTRVTVVKCVETTGKTCYPKTYLIIPYIGYLIWNTILNLIWISNIMWANAFTQIQNKS